MGKPAIKYLLRIDAFKKHFSPATGELFGKRLSKIHFCLCNQTGLEDPLP